MKRKWAEAVPSGLGKVVFSSHSLVCSLHFLPQDYAKRSQDTNITRQNERGDKLLKRRKLMPFAIPSVFKSGLVPNRSTSATAAARLFKENDRLDCQIEDFFKQEQCNNLDEIHAKMQNVRLPESISMIKKMDSLIFLSLQANEPNGCLALKCYLQIDSNLEIKLVVDGKQLNSNNVHHIVKNGKVASTSDIQNILAYVMSKVQEPNLDTALQGTLARLKNCVTLSSINEGLRLKLSFLAEQFELAISFSGKRYSQDLLITAAMWKAQSSKLYLSLVGNGLLSLPSPRHLQRLMSCIDNETGIGNATLAYLEARIKLLSPEERNVVLMVDEVYVSQKLEFAGGKLYGTEDGSLCKTVLCYMIKSVRSSYRDMVAMFPTKNLNSARLLDTYRAVLKALTEKGFLVCGISADNATPNRRFFVDELCKGCLTTSIEHPFLPKQPIFLIFDAVHCFKNIYNNFVNKTWFSLPPFENDGMPFKACFQHLIDLFKLEMGKPAKMAYKLSDKVLHPKPIEKTNVSLAVAIFDPSTIAAMEYYSKHLCLPEWKGTCRFLKIVLQWWQIVNVKNPCTGIHKRNEFQKPITIFDDANLCYLKQFNDWLLTWEAQLESKKEGLSAQTFLALKQTNSALMAAANYFLKEKNFNFLLLGQFQTDPLEERFGWYRQMSGANYFISVRQLLEAEKSIRLQSLAKFSGLTFSEIKATYSEVALNADKKTKFDAEILHSLLEDDFLSISDLADEDKNIVFYLAGYLSYCGCKSIPCLSCSCLTKDDGEMPGLEVLGDKSSQEAEEKDLFLELVNRGGLCRPSDLVYILCIHGWSLHSSIFKSEEATKFLLQYSEPRKLFVATFMSMMQSDDLGMEVTTMKCAQGHYFKPIAMQLVAKLFNIFMKCHCSEVNSCTHASQKRSSYPKCQGGKKVAKLQSCN